MSLTSFQVTGFAIGKRRSRSRVLRGDSAFDLQRHAGHAPERFVLQIGEASVDLEVFEQRQDLQRRGRQHRERDVRMLFLSGRGDPSAPWQVSSEWPPSLMCPDEYLARRAPFLAHGAGIARDATGPFEHPLASSGVSPRKREPRADKHDAELAFELADGRRQASAASRRKFLERCPAEVFFAGKHAGTFPACRSFNLFLLSLTLPSPRRGEGTPPIPTEEQSRPKNVSVTARSGTPQTPEKSSERAAVPFAPDAVRRCRQADEGPMPKCKHGVPHTQVINWPPLTSSTWPGDVAGKRIGRRGRVGRRAVLRRYRAC